ncbi:MAG: DUF2807 domain-containing protein [Bacteroidota bacterium]
MKLKPIFLLIAFCLQIGLTAQTTEKIKGSRNVTIEQTYIDDFEVISVGDDFNIDLIYNSKPSVEIETDDNLHEVIKFEVVDGVLSFKALKKITSKKALKITVNYGNALNKIEVKNTAEIRSLTSMELGPVNITVLDNSRAYLNIKATDFQFKAGGRSKTRLNINSETAVVELSDDSKLDALINSKTTKFDLYQRTDATIEGEADTSNIRIDNSSNFLGNNFTVKECSLLIEGSSDATIEVLDKFTIDASGNTETFLYGEPSITVSKLSGSAKLQKKER